MSLFHSNKRRRTASRSRQLSLETLETRQMMSAGPLPVALHPGPANIAAAVAKPHVYPCGIIYVPPPGVPTSPLGQNPDLWYLLGGGDSGQQTAHDCPTTGTVYIPQQGDPEFPATTATDTPPTYSYAGQRSVRPAPHLQTAPVPNIDRLPRTTLQTPQPSASDTLTCYPSNDGLTTNVDTSELNEINVSALKQSTPHGPKGHRP